MVRSFATDPQTGIKTRSRKCRGGPSLRVLLLVASASGLAAPLTAEDADEHPEPPTVYVPQEWRVTASKRRLGKKTTFECSIDSAGHAAVTERRLGGLSRGERRVPLAPREAALQQAVVAIGKFELLSSDLQDGSTIRVTLSAGTAAITVTDEDRIVDRGPVEHSADELLALANGASGGRELHLVSVVNDGTASDVMPLRCFRKRLIRACLKITFTN